MWKQVKEIKTAWHSTQGRRYRIELWSYGNFLSRDR